MDTGVRWRWRGASATASYFNNTYRDLLSTRPALDASSTPILIPGSPGQDPIPVSQTVNADRARIQGLELEADWAVPFGGGLVTPFGWASFMRGDDLSAGQPLDRITPRTLFAGVRWEPSTRRVWMEYGARAVTGQTRLPEDVLASRGPEEGFLVQDVRGGIRLGSDLRGVRADEPDEPLLRGTVRQRPGARPKRGRLVQRPLFLNGVSGAFTSVPTFPVPLARVRRHRDHGRDRHSAPKPLGRATPGWPAARCPAARPRRQG